MSTLGNFSSARAACVLAVALSAGTASGLAFVRALIGGDHPARDLPTLVHLIALGALALSATWLAAMIGALLWEQRHGPRAPTPLAWACPRVCRPMLIALCSAGATLGATAPGFAAPTAPAPPAAALPSLDRPIGAVTQQRDRAVIVIRSGDSLWSLTRARHPAEPTLAIARRVRTLYANNIDVIGPDPDLIRPGQVLRATEGDGEVR